MIAFIAIKSFSHEDYFIDVWKINKATIFSDTTFAVVVFFYTVNSTASTISLRIFLWFRLTTLCCLKLCKVGHFQMQTAVCWACPKFHGVDVKSRFDS